jgi:acetylornithine/N-succinyldiaminopimelate aminotransferase
LPGFVAECLANGLLLNSPKPATIRMMPALTVKEMEIDEMMNILCRVLEQAS